MTALMAAALGVQLLTTATPTPACATVKTWPQYASAVQAREHPGDAPLDKALRDVANTQQGDAFVRAQTALKSFVCARAAASTDQALAREVQQARASLPLVGQRQNPDALDHVWAKVSAWFLSLFESDAMQKYAGISRVIYLVLVALALLWAVLRILRIRRRKDDKVAAVGDEIIVQARRQSAQAHLQRARTAIAAQDGRAAFAALEWAVLARIGEVGADAQAVGPTRTHAEICAELTEPRRAKVAPLLAQIQRHWYGEGAPVDAARTVLHAVEAFLNTLDTGSGGAP